MLDVIKSNNAVIKHEHRIVQSDFIAQAFRKALDQPHHVIRKISDGAGDQRRQTR